MLNWWTNETLGGKKDGCFSLPQILSICLFSLDPIYHPLMCKFCSNIACKGTEVPLKQKERDEER